MRQPLRNQQGNRRRPLVGVRLPPDVLLRLAEQLASDGSSLSSVAASAIARGLNMPVEPRRGRQRLPDADVAQIISLRSAIARLGNNVNQIAHAMNRLALGESVPDESIMYAMHGWRAAQAELVALRHDVNDLLQTAEQRGDKRARST